MHKPSAPHNHQNFDMHPIGHGTQEGTRLGLMFLGQRIQHISNPMIPTALFRQHWILLTQGRPQA
jgi:hypothetical protein